MYPVSRLFSYSRFVLPSIPRISLFLLLYREMVRSLLLSIAAHRDVITAGQIFECIGEFQRWKKNAEKKVSKPLREDRVYSFDYFSFPYLFAAYVRGYVRESWKEARGRERKEEGEDRGGGRSGGRAYIYLCKRNRGIQLIVRSHTRGDSRDGYSGIVSACQFA